ncbi:MAG: hypothetical protein ABIS01_10005 [Ferruginibacter sp.]
MKNAFKLTAGTAAGVTTGAVLALLFAPDKGYEPEKKQVNSMTK